MLKLSKKNFVFVALFVFLQACGIYKFTGASLHPDDKTFTVKYFENNAELVNPGLSQSFTEALKTKMLNQTNLSMTEHDGDLIFEGEIVNYETEPVAITQDEQAEYNRLTIEVRVKYTSFNNPKFDFDQTFSKYADYESTKLLSDVDDALSEEIIDELTEAIFTKAVVNW